MPDVHIRTEGRAGRITLTRPKALNALTWDMVRAIDSALVAWAGDPEVALVIVDAEGDRAFCAGGDVAEIHRAGLSGDYDGPRRFWADEYRMNARLAAYRKPVVALMQGYVMGGGVGLGCHCRHRIVGETSLVAMPECGIGFVPDVGGSYLLAHAPGFLGEYLGLTAARMGPGDAIHAGFADAFVPQDDWPALVQALAETGDPAAIDTRIAPAPPAPLADARDEIDTLFGAGDLSDIAALLQASDSGLAADAAAALARNSPLAMAVTLRMLPRLREPGATVRDALELEYRVSWRILEHGDFVEGVRAAIVDKDRTPRWRHAGFDVPGADIDALLSPLGDDALDLTKG